MADHTLEAGKQPHAEKGVAPQLEEIVVEVKPAEAHHLFPNLPDLRLEGGQRTVLRPRAE